MDSPTFETFRSEALAQGFDEILERKWAPSAVTGVHTHPFSVNALVVEGEMWLTVGDEVRHLRAGERFSLDQGVSHSERYGAQGAALWVARLHR